MAGGHRICGSATADMGDAGPAAMCRKCGKQVAIYACVPCSCLVFCKKCAMKMGTGGYCMVCQALYAGVKRVDPANPPRPRTPPSSGDEEGGGVP